MPAHGGEGKAFGLGALSAGAVISAVAGTYKVAEFLLHLRKLHDVGNENDVFVRMVERVRLDLAEVDRLLSLPEIKLALSRSPEKVTWIKRVISTLRAAMEEKAKWTESVRKGVEGGRILGLKKRIWWVLEEHEKLETRRMELAMCHLGLLQVLSFLAPLEPLACCQPEGVYRANERFYREADAMIQKRDNPERRVQFESDRYIERERDDIRERPRHEGKWGEEEYTESDYNIVREYETPDGDIVLEDRREFRETEEDDQREFRDDRQEFREDQREFREGNRDDVREYREVERKEITVDREEERGSRHSRHSRHHAHAERKSERGSEDDEEIVVRRVIKRRHGHSSRL